MDPKLGMNSLCLHEHLCFVHRLWHTVQGRHALTSTDSTRQDATHCHNAPPFCTPVRACGGIAHPNAILLVPLGTATYPWSTCLATHPSLRASHESFKPFSAATPPIITQEPGQERCVTSLKGGASQCFHTKHALVASRFLHACIHVFMHICSTCERFCVRHRHGLDNAR